MGTDNRIEWIDIAKGIGMILVIAGHTFALDYSAPIYTFHMPLFFFISGMFIKTSVPFSSFLQSKSKSIFLVWFIVFAISMLVCLCIPEWWVQITPHALLRDLYSSNTNVVQNSSLWFLICLFFAELIFWFADKLKDSLNQKIFYGLFILFAIYVLWQVPVLNKLSDIIPLYGNRLPFKIDTALCAVVFIAIGNWCRDYVKQYVEKCNILIALLFFFAWGILAYINGWTNLNALAFGQNKSLFYLIALLGIVGTFSLSNYISKSKLKYINKFLSFYGKNSLIIFAFQSLFIRLYMLIINRIYGVELTLYANNPWEHQIISFIIVAFIMSPLIAYTYQKIKLYHGK